MPVVGQENPGRQQERVHLAAKINDPCNPSKFFFGKKVTPAGEVTSDEEKAIRENQSAQAGHGDRLEYSPAPGQRIAPSPPDPWVAQTCLLSLRPFAIPRSRVYPRRKAAELHNNSAPAPLLFLSPRPPGPGARTAPAVHLDLVAVARDQLRSAGLLPSNIQVAEFCTACRTDLFFSHRREGSLTGRMMAVIGIR